ncbi:MAG: hypothetical protein V1494_03740 [Candidatus Diapherotrites archaeon]
MAQEFPESGLVRRTFIVREMDLPPNVLMTKRSLLRWFALASGMISEKESRSTVLDVIDSLLYFQFSKKKNPTTLEIQSYIKEKTRKAISEKLIRYHLRRLIDQNILLRKQKKYYFNPAPNAEPFDLKQSFNFWVKEHINKSFINLETVIEKLSDSYK